MAETSTLSSGLSSARAGLSCESGSDVTSSSLVNVLERLKVPRLVFWVCNVTRIVLSVDQIHEEIMSKIGKI